MSQAPRVSVIIPHLNTPDMLARCIASVRAQYLDHGDAEIIVVDNSSSVDMAGFLAAHPDIIFLVEPQPGPGPARNLGVAAARGRTVAFIDADCRATSGWLQAAVEAVEADPSRGLFGGDICIDFSDPANPTAIEVYEAVFGFRQRLYIEIKHFSVTANLAMAPAVHMAVGPFGGIDISEDLDWGQRAEAAGFAVRYCPGMLVLHPARPDFAALCAKWRRLIWHDWNARCQRGVPVWRWRMRAIALVAAVPVEAWRFVFSERISGIDNCWRGTLVLARIRWFRAKEMLRIIDSPPDVPDWNSR